MSRKLLSICIVLLAAISANADTIYGVGPWGSFTRADLYSIDTVTGQANVIGNTGVNKVGSITYDTVTNAMYIFTTAADLYTVDIATGASTNVQYVSDTIGEGGMAAKDGLLYITDSYDLRTINPVTGQWSTIGTMDLGSMPGTVNDISGLAFGPDGFLYGYTKNGTLEDSLIKVNPDTAEAEFVGNLGISTLSVGGLVYDSTAEQMLLSDSAYLYSVDLADASTEMIGSHGAGVSGLASIVPEPATAALLAAGGLVAALRRRRN